MTLGERLFQYRTNAKMSQDTLAEKIGVTRQTISKWETDQSTPEFNKILPLCEIYGITTDELIKGEQTELVTSQEKAKTNNEIRNRKKAKTISISVFLYIIGAFSVPFMEGSMEDSDIIMILGVLWAIATVLLIYFFVSNPKEKDVTCKKSKDNQREKGNRNIEKSTQGIVILVFLLLYFILSFVTMAWHITWILWIVCAITNIIVKLLFDLKRREKNEE